MRTDHLIILAGGKATRLGPLTATMSKALVTVGQQPMIIKQILGMGITNVTVVVSPGSRDQVQDMCDRALPARFNVQLMVQAKPRGPVDALEIGLRVANVHLAERVAVLMADSLYDWEEMRAACDEPGTQLVAASTELVEREWCFRRMTGQWYDGKSQDLAACVFTGLLVADAQVLTDAVYSCTWDQVAPEMSELLNKFKMPNTCTTGSWHDTGDVEALAEARRTDFISRPHHRLELSNLGVITKYGASIEQQRFLEELRPPASFLFPTVYPTTDGVIGMEFVDLPSLAELWLYWPGPASTWTAILRTVLDRMKVLWSSRRRVDDDVESLHVAADTMLIMKPMLRLQEVDVNRDQFDDLWSFLNEQVVATTAERQVILHGDLNFCNVLMSLGTGVIKLLDPRGTFGGLTHGQGDLIYDLAKLRYSWDGFAAITHGLGYTPELRLVTAAELDIVLELHAPHVNLRQVAAVEASLFLSALPLHPPEQRDHLLTAARWKIAEALS